MTEKKKVSEKLVDFLWNYGEATADAEEKIIEQVQTLETCLVEAQDWRRRLLKIFEIEDHEEILDWFELQKKKLDEMENLEAEVQRLHIANEGNEKYIKETTRDWVEVCEDLKSQLAKATEEACKK